MIPGPFSLRALILTPSGRDSAIAAQILKAAGVAAFVCDDLEGLMTQIEAGAGLGLIAEEALRHGDLERLSRWAQAQPTWSDFPFIVLTFRTLSGDSPITAELTERLGNVSFVERPFHPTSLVSLARSAVRGRRRQYEARARIEALRQGQEQLRFAQEAGRIGTFELFPATGMLAVSGTFCRLWGLPETDQVPLSRLIDLVQPEDRGRIATNAPDPAPNALDYLEYRIRRPDTGEVRWLARQGERIVDTETGAVRFFGVTYDITERKHAEDMLREFNETLEQKVQARTHERDRAWKYSQDLQVVVDSRGIFTAANDAWTSILGWRTDEVIGQLHTIFVHPDDVPASDNALRVATTGELEPFENRVRHKDGGYRWISWVAAPERDLVYASGRHVTAEKQAAAELELAQDALRQSQKMEAVGQLTGGIAHDFNNLLGGIIGSLEMIQKRLAQGRPGEVERYIEAAQGAGRRAAALTHRLLAFSRRQTLAPKPTDVNRLVSGMGELIRRTVGPAVEMEVVEAGGLWPTLVDPHQLENALLNLCINARDAMPDGGRLTIETANTVVDSREALARDLQPGPYIRLSVADTGTGMAADVIARAFDPFFTTKPLGHGTGLGLSMIYGFVRQSGGQVRIESEVGQGTTMSLYLPRHAAAPDETAPVAPSPQTDDGGGKTILVIDDEPTMRMLVSEVLIDAGYTLIEAGDGPSGLHVLTSERPIDLLITDVGLPGGMSGRQVADAARALRPSLKVLFITGYAEDAAIGAGRLEPGMEVLTKPFPMAALSDRVRVILNA